MCQQMRHFAKKFKGKLAYPEQIIQGNGQKKIVPMHILKGCKIKLGLFKSQNSTVHDNKDYNF